MSAEGKVPISYAAKDPEMLRRTSGADQPSGSTLSVFVDCTSQLAYWRQQLNTAPPRLELPADRGRLGGSGPSGASQSVTPAAERGCRWRNTSIPSASTGDRVPRPLSPRSPTLWFTSTVVQRANCSRQNDRQALLLHKRRQTHDTLEDLQ